MGLLPVDLEFQGRAAWWVAAGAVLHVVRVKRQFPHSGFFTYAKGAATHPQNANVGLFIVGIEPPEWKEAVLKDWWYRLSCLTLIPPGIFTVMYPETYEPFNPWFPWRWGWGAALIVTGTTSYMSDVESWGEQTIWKRLDPLAATWMFLLGNMLTICEVIGWAEYPVGAKSFFLSWMVVAICCKSLSAHYLTLSRSCRGYLFYHALWHYVLAGAGSTVLLQMYLLHDVQLDKNAGTI